MNTQPASSILVVDDLPANRMVLERHLDRLGHRVRSAEHGQEALAMLHAEPADLILLDIMMPVMNGYETLGALKADPALAQIPVVVCSALNDVESVARCITLGADDFLFKPVDRILLEARVDASLARKRMHDREQAAYAAAEAANRAKDSFISLVSHELKNPITGVIGYADTMLQEIAGPLTPLQRECLQGVRSLGDQMSAILGDLSDLSRIETGNLRLELEPTPLGKALDAAIHGVRGLLEARGHRLRVDLDGRLPLVWADRVRLAQVLTNLLSNACKYSGDGGAIAVEASLSGPVVEVVVIDSGHGIRPEEQQQIFEPFFRSADAASYSQPGSGLGLGITRHLVELHGGQIWFESVYGEGTRFHFTILAAPTSQDTGAPDAATPSGGTG